MDRWRGKVAVVTGASAGIGLCIAKALMKKEMIVVGLARRKEKMEESMKNAAESKGKFHALECDVSDEEKVIRAFNYIKENIGVVQILINNAGILRHGAFTEVDSEVLRQVVNLNVMGLMYCSREAVKMMKGENCEGHIVNIGSIAGHRVMHLPGLNINVYPGSKFAVRAISEGLSNELIGSKIRVTHISPGVVKTDIFEVAGFDNSFLENTAGLESEDIADAIIYAVGSKPYVDIQEITLRHIDQEYR